MGAKFRLPKVSFTKVDLKHGIKTEIWGKEGAELLILPSCI